MPEEETLNIDFLKISQELRVRPEVLKRLIASFASSLAEKMKFLEEAFSQNDTARMRSILHEIKGTAGNLRLTSISAAEHPMHEAVLAGAEKEKIAEHFQILKLRVEELQTYIRK
ncbi:MAG: Hpt domain-containing protein [Candidatus Omnitrophota bacterium]